MTYTNLPDEISGGEPEDHGMKWAIALAVFMVLYFGGHLVYYLIKY